MFRGEDPSENFLLGILTEDCLSNSEPETDLPSLSDH